MSSRRLEGAELGRAARMLLTSNRAQIVIFFLVLGALREMRP
jgi:hypothetical protein